jgi:hypothetical protein
MRDLYSVDPVMYCYILLLQNCQHTVYIILYITVLTFINVNTIVILLY